MVIQTQNRSISGNNISLWGIGRFWVDNRPFRDQIGLFRIENRYFWIKNNLFLPKMMNLVTVLQLTLPYHNSNVMPVIIYHNSYCFVFSSVPIILQLLQIDEAETRLHNLSSWSSSLNSHLEEVPIEIPIMLHLHQMLKYNIII